MVATASGIATRVQADKDDSKEVSLTESKSMGSGWLSLLVKDNSTKSSGMAYAWGGDFGRKPVHLQALGDDITEIAVTKDGAGVSLDKLGRVTLFSYDEGLEKNPTTVSLHPCVRATNIALKSDRREVVLVDETGKLHTTALLSKSKTLDSDEKSRQAKGNKGNGSPHSGNSMNERSLDRVILQSVNDREVHRRVRSVKCGQRHCAAVTFCGRVFTWGDNSHGQLGNRGKPQDDDDPSNVSTYGNGVKNTSNSCVAREMQGPPEMSAIVDVACGENHTLVVDDNGSVYGCGSDSWTQLATSAHPWKSDHQTSHHNLTNASLLHPLAVASVAAGTDHSVFLMRDGNLYTSGFNQFGQLAHHNYSSFAPPSPIANFALRVKKVAAGGNVTCVITEDQNILCIGANSSGQLGIGSQQPSAAWRKPNIGKKARITPIYIYVGDESAAIIATKNCAMNTLPSTALKPK